jgi:hypothetical protein
MNFQNLMFRHARTSAYKPKSIMWMYIQKSDELGDIVDKILTQVRYRNLDILWHWIDKMDSGFQHVYSSFTFNVPSVLGRG